MSGEAQLEEGRRTRQRMLAYIAGYQQSHGWAPTVREIAGAVGLASPSSVHKHLITLRDQGELVLGNGPRMIRLQGTIDLRPDDQQPPPANGRHPLRDVLTTPVTPIPARHVGADGRLEPGR